MKASAFMILLTCTAVSGQSRVSFCSRSSANYCSLAPGGNCSNSVYLICLRGSYKLFSLYQVHIPAVSCNRSSIFPSECSPFFERLKLILPCFYLNEILVLTSSFRICRKDTQWLSSDTFYIFSFILSSKNNTFRKMKEYMCIWYLTL